jgi:chemotaxis protein MotB
MKSPALLLTLALAGCHALPGAAVEPSSPNEAEAAAPTLEQLYAAHRYGEVVLMATGIVEAGTDDPELVAHARFFRALARLAQGGRGVQARGIAELHELELELPDSAWGRVAAAYMAHISRADALQEALVEFTLELHELRGLVASLEQQLAEAEAETARKSADLASVQSERSQLRERLAEVEAQAASAARRVAALEEELAGLKRIDMQRDP